MESTSSPALTRQGTDVELTMHSSTIRQLKKLIAANSIIIIMCILQFIVHIYTNTSSAKKKQPHDKWAYFIFEMFITAIALINSILGLVLAINEKRVQNNSQNLHTDAVNSLVTKRILSYERLNNVHLGMNLICFILFTVFLIVQFIYWCGGLLVIAQQQNAYRYFSMLLVLIIILCYVACCMWNMVVNWSPVYKFSRSVLLFSSIFLTALSLAATIINGRINKHNKNNGGVPLWCFQTEEGTGVLNLVCGLFGIGRIIAIRGTNRQKCVNSLLRVYKIFCVIGISAAILFTIIILSFYKHLEKLDNPYVYTLIHADPVLSVLQCILLLMILKSEQEFQTPTRTELKVERINLSTQPEALLNRWAIAIDLYGRQSPDSMTGEAALQLIKAYEQNQIENVTCLCLRVSYRDRKYNIPQIQQPPSLQLLDAAAMLQQQQQQQQQQEQQQQQQEQQQQQQQLSSSPPLPPQQGAKVSTFSKRELRKIERKNYKRTIEEPEVINQANINENRIEQNHQQQSTTQIEWDDTEAIVLLSIIKEYDATLSSDLVGTCGTILKKTLGSGNCTKRFRPLVLRMGLLGFQWPFRSGVFFLTPTRRPLARASSVLRAIVDWNDEQNSKDCCDLLLLPIMQTELISHSIHSAGFFHIPLPPSHILDLRPHHGKNWDQYMRTLKKSNRRNYLAQFLKNHGTIEEVKDLDNPVVSQAVYEKWLNIATLRQANNEPPTLAQPKPPYIECLGRTMSDQYRSVVFLRVNNEIIASSVLFKFPYSLITTDIQGLVHEKARPVKAYFVMLQWVIELALKEKFAFIDFGPTTASPKMDLGCASVPLCSGGYAGNPILAFGIQKVGSDIEMIHDNKKSQNNTTVVQQQPGTDEVSEQPPKKPKAQKKPPQLNKILNSNQTDSKKKKKKTDDNKDGLIDNERTIEIESESQINEN
ncbi:unnamed protein product [Didymodactylos carnosus]|uniref:BioF2-like acetyltransferase domain-containing protein n=1 Tax=Didymodactylos carnosus TaxID=1234261 RepID=A0A8S2HGN8_9BILA|nr:unnamed protein product [Didymodactylos carnosus]CAF3643848.1 unnamed protein product [Didymodactylos carnosus]